MAKTYQEFASENLALFGWTMAPADIPEYATCVAALNEIGMWWISLDERTKSIIGACDLAPGLHAQGLLDHWPGLFNLLSGNAYGFYASTHNDVSACLERAHNQVSEQPQPYEPTEI